MPPEVYENASAHIENNRRIDFELAGLLLLDGDLVQLGRLADSARRKRVGDKVYFIRNYHLYYTNICAWHCDFCAFSRRPGAVDAYSKTISQITHELEDLAPEIMEIRVTGGINPALPSDYYLDLVACIRQKLPDVQIEAFAATEISFIAHKMKLPVREVLLQLKAAGLNALTAGGAEIFNRDLRQKLCPHKPSIQEWIEVTKTAHQLGIPSNASILFGHLESYEDWLTQLFALRELQDETGGFNSFIPLVFLPQNTRLRDHPPLNFSEVLKMLAIARLILDNFKYIKFLWIYYGLEQVRQALQYGVNDLAGTVYERHKGVARSAGSVSPAYQTQEDLLKAIQDCQRIPVERGRFYEEKYVWG